MDNGQFKDIRVELDGAVATIVFARPERLNALDENMHVELMAALEELNPGDEVRVIRLKGEGRAFCAGADMGKIYDKYFDELPARGPNAADLGESRLFADRVWLRLLAERHLALWSYRKPVVAQVQGYCLGAGIEIIGSCDLIFAAASAKFGHPPARAHGIPVTIGQWPRKIGAIKAKELLFTGDMIEASEAERLGMINGVFVDDDLDARTLEHCQRIAKVPLDALTSVKHLVNRWEELAGLRTAILEGPDYNAMYHTSAAFDRFIEIAAEQGLAAALAWRDAPFKSV